MVEDRLVGIKSREVYEAPGAIALITAHQELENVTVERDLARFKRSVDQRWGEHPIKAREAQGGGNGCKFLGRCPYAMDVCQTVPPATIRSWVPSLLTSPSRTGSVKSSLS